MITTNFYLLLIMAVQAIRKSLTVTKKAVIICFASIFIVAVLSGCGFRFVVDISENGTPSVGVAPIQPSIPIPLANLTQLLAGR